MKKKIIFGLNHSKTIKANKMIAEFMGFEVISGPWKAENGEAKPAPEGFINEFDLRYDESWDALIPVFRKIGSLIHGSFRGAEESKVLHGLGMFGMMEINDLMQTFFNPSKDTTDWTEEEWINHSYLIIVKILEKINKNKQEMLSKSHKS